MTVDPAGGEHSSASWEWDSALWQLTSRDIIPLVAAVLHSAMREACGNVSLA